MPLTISHPAAAVPLARSGLALSALVIGSMTPDFPYFFPFFPYGYISHSLIGLLIYCLPVGLFSLGVFHFLIKYPVLSLLGHLFIVGISAFAAELMLYSVYWHFAGGKRG